MSRSARWGLVLGMTVLVGCDQQDARPAPTSCAMQMQMYGRCLEQGAAAAPAVGSAEDRRAPAPAAPPVIPPTPAPATPTPTPSTTKASKRTGSKGGGGRTEPAKPPVKDSRTRGRANGAACTWDEECASESCERSVCESGDRHNKKLGNGVSCRDDDDCASGECDSGRCSSGDRHDKKLGNGVACSSDDDCASENCDFRVCADD